MYKALHANSGAEIVILQPDWIKQVAYLRQLDQEDCLICPGCLQPVRVRAGQMKRWHFAHKHLQNCPFEPASPSLLEARALLYQRLVECFPADAVTVEKVLPTTLSTASQVEARLPRPMDCWVETEGSGTAYWIIENRLAPQAREQLKAGFAPVQGQVQWIFLASMLKEDDLGAVILTTTEREFKVTSSVDVALAGSRLTAGASLHYLDAARSLLTTYRNLRLVHSPQLHAGLKRTGPLSEAAVNLNTGELLHPGEIEVVEHYREAEQARSKTVREAREVFAQGLAERRRRGQPGSTLPPRAHGTGETAPHAASGQAQGERQEALPPPAADSLAPYRPDWLQNEAGVCVHCGERTSDWWWIDRRTKECKCRACYRKGLG